MYIEFDFRGTRYRVPKLNSTQTQPEVPDIEIRVAKGKSNFEWQKARHPDKGLVRAAKKQYPLPPKLPAEKGVPDDRRHYSRCSELDYDQEG